MDDPCPVTPVRQEALSVSSAPEPAGSGGADDPAVEDLAGLKQDMALMKAELASVRGSLKQVAAQVQPPPSHGNAEATAPNYEPQAVDSAAEEAAAMEETTRLQEKRIESIGTALRTEPLDAAWATQAMDAIRQAMSSATMSGTSIHDVECRSSLCRVEVAHENPAARARFIRRFAMLVGPMLPTMTAQPIEAGDGAFASLIYLAREGHDLPPFEP